MHSGKSEQKQPHALKRPHVLGVREAAGSGAPPSPAEAAPRAPAPHLLPGPPRGGPRLLPAAEREACAPRFLALHHVPRGPLEQAPAERKWVQAGLSPVPEERGLKAESLASPRDARLRQRVQHAESRAWKGLASSPAAAFLPIPSSSPSRSSS